MIEKLIKIYIRVFVSLEQTNFLYIFILHAEMCGTNLILRKSNELAKEAKLV